MILSNGSNVNGKRIVMMRFKTKEYNTYDHFKFTILSTAIERTADPIELFSNQSLSNKGKKIVVFDGFIPLNKENGKSVAQSLMEADIQLVFALGAKMKSVLRYLPEQKIGGHFDNINQLARQVTNLLCEDDVVYVIGTNSDKMEERISHDAQRHKQI